MSNRVIAGDHLNGKISSTLGTVFLKTMLGKQIVLDKSVVDSYEVITEEHRKSAVSGITRGLVGGVLLGPVGMLGGGLSAKNKGTYHVAIEWKDGGKSLIEINKKVYKNLMKSLF